jgi:5-methylthioadenosine/S-adenosylhomocysteine deaminase
MYKETIRLSEEFNVNLYMHSSENINWNIKGKEVHGRTTNIGIFKKFGCLGPNTNIAAMRIFSEEDIADLSESSCSVIFDPTPSLNWGTGLPPISRIKNEGIAVGLGTNGASSNYGQDMFETMKNAIAIARTVDGSPEALPLYEALEMATIHNARMLGLDAHVGSLEVGKKADIITLGVTKPHHTPCLNVLAATVLSSRGSDVEEVIVDGNIIISRGKLVDLDEASIIEEANDRALHFARKAHLDDRILFLS